MPGAPFFAKPCPTCGRMTQINVSLMGRLVCCQHCGREFTANAPDSESAALDDPVQYWINFTDHALVPTDDSMRHPR